MFILSVAATEYNCMTNINLSLCKSLFNYGLFEFAEMHNYLTEIKIYTYFGVKGLEAHLLPNGVIRFFLNGKLIWR